MWIREFWWSLVFVLCGMCGQAGAVGNPAPEFEMEVKGRIEIGPEGHVLSYTIDDSKVTQAAVKTLVRKAVDSWRFEPIIDNGKPVIGMTGMSLTLSAIPDGDAYLMRVDGVYFGTASPSNLKSPEYPSDLARQGVSGQVVLVLRLDAEGRVTKVHVERTDLGRVGPAKTMGRWRRGFEDVAMEAARGWQFDPVEVFDGKPVAGDVRIPVSFQFYGTKWAKLYRGESTLAPWLTEKHLARNDELPGDRPVSIDSHFKLLSDVIGTML